MRRILCHSIRVLPAALALAWLAPAGALPVTAATSSPTPPINVSAPPALRPLLFYQDIRLPTASDAATIRDVDLFVKANLVSRLPAVFGTGIVQFENGPKSEAD